MKTYSKSLLIAVAALAVTTTGAYAHGGIVKRADLSDEQRSALIEAHELRKTGDIEAARDRLLEAGFDEETLEQMRERHEARREHMMERLEAELTDEQLEAVMVAKAANDRETVHAILEEAGIEHGKHKGHHRGSKHQYGDRADDMTGIE